MNSDNVFGEAIYTYTRKQAIEDGVLADLSQVETMRAHWKFPVACTAEVWAMIERALEEPCQDLNGICHDISCLAKHAIGTAGPSDIIFFSVIIAGKKHALKLHIGPGDTPAPVLTLMYPHED